MPSQLSRIEAKLDALLDKAGIKPETLIKTETAPAPRVLTPQEQDAINAAPKVATAPAPTVQRRTTTTNAPDVSSSLPPVEPTREAARVEDEPTKAASKRKE